MPFAIESALSSLTIDESYFLDYSLVFSTTTYEKVIGQYCWRYNPVKIAEAPALVPRLP